MNKKAATLSEKKALSNAKLKWRTGCRSHYGLTWTKRSSSRLHNGSMRINVPN